jgi:cytosine/adenosine deaminase-related metal-dependent hydrolase
MRAASVDGYRSLGWAEGGTVADGEPADFVLVRTDTVNTAGSKAGQILYSATRSDVDLVVVGGQVVVRDGQHRLGDVAGLLTSSLAAVREHR